MIFFSITSTCLQVEVNVHINSLYILSVLVPKFFFGCPSALAYFLYYFPSCAIFLIVRTIKLAAPTSDSGTIGESPICPKLCIVQRNTGSTFSINLNLSPLNTLRAITSGELRWAGHVTWVGEGRCAFEVILTDQPAGKRSLEKK